jgi:recombinational DNA repair protein (RecF pathway)
MLFASAQGVRKITSKLRFVLSDYSYIKLDLVRGRDFWRITSCIKTNELEEIKNKKGNLKVFVQVAKLLKRLLAGEEANEVLFHDLIRGLRVLENANTTEELENIEVMLVLRILNNLGYIGQAGEASHLIQSPIEDELVFEISKNRAKILRQINQALKETHL